MKKESSEIDYSDPDVRERLLARMASLCASREMCRSEIATKLKNKGVPAHIAESMVSDLVRLRFIDEHRYARAFVEDKMLLNGWGPWKIRAALKAKGVDENAVAEAMQEIVTAGETMRQLRRVAEAKMRSLSGDPRAIRVKMYRFLASRGYGSADISRVLEMLNIGEEDYAPDDD